MRNRLATLIALTMCTLAIVVPIAAALSLAQRQSVQEATDQAVSLASEMRQRSDGVFDQAMSAYLRLRRVPSTPRCTDAKRALMRTVVMDYDYLQAIGYVEGQRITCSAIGAAVDGADLGSDSYINPMGTSVYPSVSIAGGRPVMLMVRSGLAAAIHPEILLSGSSNIANLAQGIYGRSADRLWIHRGHFDRAWLARLGNASQVVFSDADYLVVIQASDKFDMATYVAVPASHLRKRLHTFATVLLPIGLALGAAMVGAIVFLTRQRTSLPAILRAGLKRKEFVLYYQPIVELASGRMAGAEALLRWPSNKQVGMRPALLVQAAEECGLIHRFTEYVLGRVAIDGPAFFRQHPGAYLSINLSSVDLRSNDIVDWLQRLVTTPGIAPYNLVVEITEHSFIDPDRAQQIIGQIRAMGIRVAIDDFGTGFSSLSHLHNLSADYLKIDKVFVDAIGTDSVTSEVVLHIIEMARSLNLTLISEGVETPEQADYLREHGVQFAQGWLYSKAQPMADLLARDVSR